MNACDEPLTRDLRPAERETDVSQDALFLASIVESSPEAILVETLDGRIASWNAGAEQVFGWKAAEAIGQPIRLLVPEQQCAELEAMIRRASQLNTAQRVETVRFRRDGSLIDVLLSLAPIRRKSGELLGYLSIARDITREKQARDKLAASEARYRMLVESIPHAVWTTGPDGLTTFMNQRGAECIGRPADAVNGWAWLALLHPEDVADTAKAWNHCVATGLPYRREYRIRAADGQFRWTLAQAFPLRTPEGHIDLWVGTWTDIDDRKRAEEALRQTTDLLRAVADGVPDALFVKDREGRYLLFNAAAARFVGRPVEEVIGHDDAELFDAQGAEHLYARDRRVMETGEVQTEEEVLTAAGVTRTYLATKAPYRDAQGRIVGVLGISRDITEQKEAEEALLLRDRAIRAATQGIVIIDPTLPGNPIVYLSPAFERMTGCSPGDSLDPMSPLFVNLDTNQVAPQGVNRALREGRAFTVEIHRDSPDGSRFRGELSLSPVRNAEGELTNFIGVLTDVTGRHELETQLRQSQKMDAIGRLAGGVAHDFNNLLTIIIASSELLLDGQALDPAARTLIQEIKKAGERSAALTSQLLTFSRKQILSPAVLNLNDVLRDTEKMLRRLIGEDVRIALILHPDLGHICVDRGQIEQVILNLVVNSRDAMPQGGTLTIETKNVRVAENSRPGLRPGSFVLLTISDSGVGMPPDVQRRIFEPFFTTKAPGKGTGLGLPVVYGVIEQSDGHIELESEVGQGTTFRIYLPLVEREPTASSHESGSPLPLGTGTILLAEDEEGVRCIATQVLQRCGYNVLTAGSEEEALAVARDWSDPIDLLVTDVIMRDGGGRVLAEQLSLSHPDMKVLYISGYPDDAVLRYGISQESVSFLQKPFSPQMLARRVHELLDSDSQFHQN